MQINKTIWTIVLILLLAFFVGGVVHLFILRFETGDVYPAYSSLRSDPLGARAFYESLLNFDDMPAGRNYQNLHSLKFEPDTTFFYLGVSSPEYNSVPEELIKVFDRLTQAGGRLVLSFLPVHKKIENSTDDKCRQKKIDAHDKMDTQSDDEARDSEHNNRKHADKPPASKSKSQKTDDPEFDNLPAENKFVSVKTHLGVGFEFNEDLPVDNDKYLVLDATTNRPGLPSAISWHTNLYFDLFDDTWRVIYSCQGRPVIIERPFGEGTIVLSADSFFVSNEAMRSERHPQLLIWLTGSNSKIIFDEAHFGIYKQPGVAGLLRHYRFQWFFGALAVLAILFVWKNAVYFVPPVGDDDFTDTDVVSGKDYTQGLIALLRRNLGGSKVLEVCAKEWVQTFKKDRHLREATFKRVNSMFQTKSHSPGEKIDPVKGYRKISRIISEDKTYE